MIQADPPRDLPVIANVIVHVRGDGAIAVEKWPTRRLWAETPDPDATRTDSVSVDDPTDGPDGPGKPAGDDVPGHAIAPSTGNVVAASTP